MFIFSPRIIRTKNSHDPWNILISPNLFTHCSILPFVYFYAQRKKPRIKKTKRKLQVLMDSMPFQNVEDKITEAGPTNGRRSARMRYKYHPFRPPKHFLLPPERTERGPCPLNKKNHQTNRHFYLKKNNNNREKIKWVIPTSFRTVHRVNSNPKLGLLKLCVKS